MSEYHLPEQRERLRLVYGGISAWHVLREATFPASNAPGMWTRKAWDRAALCGSLRACVVGGDAAAWPENEAIRLDDITCGRCRARYERMTARPPTPKDNDMNETYAAAIQLLESQRAALSEGLNSIASQEEGIAQQRESLRQSETRLAEDKQALIDIDRALGLLRAGAPA